MQAYLIYTTLNMKTNSNTNLSAESAQQLGTKEQLHFLVCVGPQSLDYSYHDVPSICPRNNNE